MKYIISVLIFVIVFLNLICINGMQFCGFKNGLYINVKSNVYEVYRPIEQVTNQYIQIDTD